jgi:hypothetical protein
MLFPETYSDGRACQILPSPSSSPAHLRPDWIVLSALRHIQPGGPRSNPAIWRPLAFCGIDRMAFPALSIFEAPRTADANSPGSNRQGHRDHSHDGNRAPRPCADVAVAIRSTLCAVPNRTPASSAVGAGDAHRWESWCCLLAIFGVPSWGRRRSTAGPRRPDDVMAAIGGNTAVGLTRANRRF